MQQEHECSYNYKPLDSLNSQLRFAAGVCLFGGFLHSSPYVKNASWDDLINLTKASMDSADPLQTEFLDLVTKSKKIYQPAKKRKRRHE